MQNVVNLHSLLLRRALRTTKAFPDQEPAHPPPPKKVLDVNPMFSMRRVRDRGVNQQGPPIGQNEQPRVRLFLTRHMQSLSNAVNDVPQPLWALCFSLSKCARYISSVIQIVIMQMYVLLFFDQGASLSVDFPLSNIGVQQAGRFAAELREGKLPSLTPFTAEREKENIPISSEQNGNPPPPPRVVFVTSNLRRAQQTLLASYDPVLKGGSSRREKPHRVLIDPNLMECCVEVDAEWFHSIRSASSHHCNRWVGLEHWLGFDSKHHHDASHLFDFSFHHKHCNSSSTETPSAVNVWTRQDTFCDRLFASKANYFCHDSPPADCVYQQEHNDQPHTAVVVGHGCWIKKFFQRYTPPKDRVSQMLAPLHTEERETVLQTLENLSRGGIPNGLTIQVDLVLDDQTKAPTIDPMSVSLVRGKF